MVYFVERSEYKTPHGTAVTKFADADLLSWFRRMWVSVDELARPEEFD